jgi:hypothetical protein
MASSHYVPKRRTALLVMITAVFNFIFLIFPYSQIRGNPPLDLALRMSHSWSQSTVVYYRALNGDDLIIKYFSPQASWRQLNPDASTISENELRQIYRNGGTAWINTAAIDFFSSSSDGEIWLQNHTKEQSRFELVNQKYRDRYFQIFPVSPELLTNNSFNPTRDRMALVIVLRVECEACSRGRVNSQCSGLLLR